MFLSNRRGQKTIASAFEAEEANQARTARAGDEERGLLRSLRAGARTLSEVSGTEGVLIEIANEQVQVFLFSLAICACVVCVCLFAPVSFLGCGDAAVASTALIGPPLKFRQARLAKEMFFDRDASSARRNPRRANGDMLPSCMCLPFPSP